MKTRTYTIIFARFLFAALLFVSGTASLADSYKPAEQWVLERTAIGEVADLKNRFPREEDRTIRSSFIEDLLTGSLPNVRVHRHGVRVRGAVFSEPVDLENANVAMEVSLTESLFRKGLRLQKSRFGGFLSLDRSTLQRLDGFKLRAGALLMNDTAIAGPFDLSYSQLGNLEANRLRLTGGETARFDAMAVSDRVVLLDSQFADGVSFGGARVGGDFGADGVRFASKKEISFDSMRIGGTAYFRHCLFEGPVFVEDAKTLDLLLTDAAKPLDELSLARTEINRELRLEAVRIRKLNASGLRVDGFSSLKLVVETSGSFEDSSFLELSLLGIPWPGEIRLDGMTYRHLSAGSDANSWQLLLGLVDRARYSAEVYTTLETFFARQGYKDRADEVFVHRKNRERQEELTGAAQIWSFLLWILVRYGRNPEWILWWSAIPILFGTSVFHRDGMESRSGNSTKQRYSALWYSLDLFLPFVNLYVKDHWTPGPDRRFAQAYMRVHIVLGWILVPIGLASGTGIIR